MISPTSVQTPPAGDPVALFEAHRARMIRDKLVVNITLLALFLGFLAWSIYISRFTPDRLAAGFPRIFEYFGSVMPQLQWDLLFEGRNEQGRFPPGSIGFWYSDFWRYIRLIWETILMAITATILGTSLGLVLASSTAKRVSD